MAAITTTYYTLNDCCTNEPIDWPANEGGLQGTLYLEFNGFCNEGEFNNTPCPNDLTNLIITEITNEAQINITGCLKLTSVSITEIPGDADITDWENIMLEVATVPTCEECQTCSLPVYYTFNDCCTNEPFKLDGEILVFEYQIGDCFSGVCPADMEGLVITALYDECIPPCTPIVEGCFNLTTISSPPIDSVINDWIVIADFDSVQTCAECQECCYKLTNCETDEVIYSNSTTLIQHFGNTVTLNGQEGCWEVGISAGICDCLTVTITTDQTSENYTANATGTYNGYNLYEFTLDGDIVYIWFGGGVWAISANGYGEDPALFEIAEVKFDGDCPDSVNEGFTWVLDMVPFNSIETEVCPEECTCPIPVTVLQSFDDCPSCLPIIAYKFTNCNNQTLVQYSTEDYSAYVGKTVELECGNCWFVSQIDYTPPSTQTITILYTFDSCLTCNRTYYKLVDCLDPNVNIVYTYTDLSQYLGQTIKIKGCDSCFTVLEETREPVNPGIVEVTDSYIDCPECLGTFPCVCTKVSNTTNTEQTYCYIDCDFNQQSVTLLPGESSDKICVIKWIGCPQNTCECLEGALTRTVEGNTVIISYKFEKTTEIKNGKPVYNGYLYFSDDVNAYVKFKLSYEIDNCWYATTDVGDDSFPFNPAPVFKLCTDSDCPVGDWEYVECGCTVVTLSPETGDISFRITVTGLDTNGYFIYENPVYIITYNITLGRWELYEKNPLKLIAYSDPTANNCAIITGARETWTIVEPSIYFEVTTDPCANPAIIYEYNTIECQIQCDCFTIEIAYDDFYEVPGLTFTGIPVLSGNTINGKPQYIFNSGVDLIFYIHWNSETNCWVLSDTNVVNGDPISNTYATLCDSLNANCPIGIWGLPASPSPLKAAAEPTQNITSVITDYCTDSNGVIGSPTPPDYIEHFGDCINGQCPVVPFPKRKVKPGYSTPSCDIEKYEKITCKSSEIYYKQVMRLRYGISNCCPEDEEKWLVKKELIDLDALRDPDYICTPVTTCCNQPISSCGCGCNQTLKTCNS